MEIWNIVSQLIFLIGASIFFGVWLHNVDAGWFMFAALFFIDKLVDISIDKFNV